MRQRGSRLSMAFMSRRLYRIQYYRFAFRRGTRNWSSYQVCHQRAQRFPRMRNRSAEYPMGVSRLIRTPVRISSTKKRADAFRKALSGQSSVAMPILWAAGAFAAQTTTCSQTEPCNSVGSLLLRGRLRLVVGSTATTRVSPQSSPCSITRTPLPTLPRFILAPPFIVFGMANEP
jgi:hypothetical protein